MQQTLAQIVLLAIAFTAVPVYASQTEPAHPFTYLVMLVIAFGVVALMYKFLPRFTAMLRDIIILLLVGAVFSEILIYFDIVSTENAETIGTFISFVLFVRFMLLPAVGRWLKTGDKS